MKYDNDKNMAHLITKKYSDSDIERMIDGIEQDNWNYSKLKSHYAVQCLRKTYQGYYALFLKNDGDRVFAFMNREMEIYYILVFESIKEKEEYNFLEIGKTTEGDILEFDNNSILLPISSVACTAHIVQEGLLFITYDRIDTNEGRLLTDPVVKSVTFFKNGDFPLNDNEMINLNVPYILEKDRK